MSAKKFECLPPGTNTNASPAIPMVVRMMGTSAAISHLRPCRVFGRTFHAMPFDFAAVARIASSVPKVGAVDRHLHATFTPAQPHILSVLVEKMGTENSPFAERPTSNVYEAVSVASRILSSHLSLLNRFDWLDPTRSHNLLVGSFHYNMNQAG